MTLSTRMLYVAAAGLAVATAAGPAWSETISGATLRDLVSGKSIFLSTPYGLELPLKYRQDGTVSGDVSGFSMARMFAPRETGSWWVDGDRLCQKWPTWYEGRTLCFTLSRSGPSTLSWVRQDGLRGTARIAG